MPELHKYSGAGNDFVVLDGRSEDVSAFRTPERIAALCDRQSGFLATDGVRRIAERELVFRQTCPKNNSRPLRLEDSAERRGADGLMILNAGDGEYDFRMEYYNSDGSGGMMCGNGGRCIVAFADELGLKPRDGRVFRFAAADGPHTGEIIARDGGRKTVRLRMIDVHVFHPALDGWFVDTGTRHFVRFVPDAEAVDIEEEGRRARWDPVFAPVGANANFVSVDPDGTLRVRTFEKGVEAETLACGTGITASAIAAFLASPRADREEGCHFNIQARIDRLAVEFRPLPDGSGFTDVYLTGPAEEIR